MEQLFLLECIVIFDEPMFVEFYFYRYGKIRRVKLSSALGNLKRNNCLIDRWDGSSFSYFFGIFFFFLKLNNEINIREKLIKGGEIYKKSNSL